MDYVPYCLFAAFRGRTVSLPLLPRSDFDHFPLHGHSDAVQVLSAKREPKVV